MSTHTRTGLIAFALVVGLFLGIGGLVAVVAGGGRGTARIEAGSGKVEAEPQVYAAPSRTDQWDIRDLADHLRKNGFPKLEMKNGANYTTYFMLKLEIENVETFNADLNAKYHSPASMKDYVVAWEHSGDRKDAERFVRSHDDASLKYYMAWGKFVIKGSEGDLAKIKAALR